jgi:DNA-directed RNA polymerase subunit RPC12/RpoP
MNRTQLTYTCVPCRSTLESEETTKPTKCENCGSANIKHIQKM